MSSDGMTNLVGGSPPQIRREAVRFGWPLSLAQAEVFEQRGYSWARGADLSGIAVHLIEVGYPSVELERPRLGILIAYAGRSGSSAAQHDIESLNLFLPNGIPTKTVRR